MRGPHSQPGHARATIRRRSGINSLARLGALLLALAAPGCTGDEASAPRVAPREPVPAAGRGIVVGSILSVVDARADASGWWIADRVGHTLHRLDSEGRRVASFGRRGEGPGEFRGLLGVVLRGDTVVAFDGGGPRFHYFLPDGTFIREERVRVDGCLGLVPEVARELPGEGFVVAAQCFGSPARGIRGGLFLHRPGGEAPALEVLAPERELRHRFNPLIRPLAAPGSAGVWFGEMNGPCVVLVARPLEARPPERRDRRICPPEWRRVDLPASIRQEFERVTAGAAVARTVLPIPELLPAYDGLFTHPAGVLLRVPVGDGVTDLVLLRPDGRTRTLLEDLPELVFAEGSRVLAAWEEAEGTRIEVLSLQEETP